MTGECLRGECLIGPGTCLAHIFDLQFSVCLCAHIGFSRILRRLGAGRGAADSTGVVVASTETGIGLGVGAGGEV